MKNPRIIHVLADGSRVDSMKGRTVPAESPAYKIIYEVTKKK